MTKEIVLPTERRGAVNYNPRLLVLYGLPKSGKSSAIASLDDNLIVDLEDGYRALNVMSVLAQDIGEIFRVKKALDDKMKETGNVVSVVLVENPEDDVLFITDGGQVIREAVHIGQERVPLQGIRLEIHVQDIDIYHLLTG